MGLSANWSNTNYRGINIDFEAEEQFFDAMYVLKRSCKGKTSCRFLADDADVMPENDDFRMKELNEFNDYILMAYDQHYSGSDPGPLPNKMGGKYWMKQQKAYPHKNNPVLPAMDTTGPIKVVPQPLRTPEAMATAKEFNATVDFDNDSYNSTYRYVDYKNIHQLAVFWMDAAGNFNSTRFADQYGTGGTALWRLGAEDERLWKFYGRSLTAEALKKRTVWFFLLEATDVTTEDPDYGWRRRNNLMW